MSISFGLIPDTEVKLRQCVSWFQGGIPEPWAWGAAAANEAARLVGFVKVETETDGKESYMGLSSSIVTLRQETS